MTTTPPPSVVTITLPAGIDATEIAAALDDHAQGLATAAATAALQLPPDHGSARVPGLSIARQLARAERFRLAARAITDAAQSAS